MASAILYGKCLYGQESHYLTQRHFHTMRGLMTLSMGLPRGQRRSGVFLLNFHNGAYDPEVVRGKRLTKFWIRYLRDHHIPQDYWRQAHIRGKGGPIQLLQRFLRLYGIQADTPTVWIIEGTPYDLLNHHGCVEAVGAQIRNCLWAKHTRQRTLLQGLQSGRDTVASQHMSRQQDPRAQAFGDLLLCGAVLHTPGGASALG